MSEHTKLIVDLNVVRKQMKAERYDGAVQICERAIEALRGIQSKADEPKIDADATLLNQFAGLAMQGLIVRGNGGSEYIVKMSFDIARAMVEESKK